MLAVMGSHLGRVREGAALSARKKTAHVRSRRKDGQLSSQPPLTTHFENSPATLQNYQEASVGKLTRTGASLLLCEGPETRHAQPRKDWALPGRSQVHV